MVGLKTVILLTLSGVFMTFVMVCPFQEIAMSW